MSQGYPQAREPFRKRRPLVFFFLVLLSLLILIRILLAVWDALDSKGVFSGPRIGLVRLEGFIGDAEKVVSWTEKLRRDSSVAGVLIRIDSPGGAVAPSQEIHTAFKRLAMAKPTVVSMGSVAASGGYYAAVAANEIFASPSTLTGSIGVRLQLTNMRGLMERIGVSSESLTTGAFKAVGSPFEEVTPEQRAYLKSLLEDMQDEFVTAVAQGRNMTKDAVKRYADGRVLTGRQALEAKLIDHIGDREAAVTRLMALCAMETMPDILEAPEQAAPWWKLLLTSVLDLEAARATEVSRYTFCY